MEKEFCLEEYLNRAAASDFFEEKDDMARFEQICRIVEAEFDKEWKETDDEAKNRKLGREKRAIMGFEEETAFYKEKIREILREKKLAEAGTPTGIRIFPKGCSPSCTVWQDWRPGLTTWTKNTGVLRRQS